MQITQEDLQGNPRLAEAVNKALLKEKPLKKIEYTVNGKYFEKPIIIKEEKKRNKYGIDISDEGKEKRTDKDGILFASLKEKERWEYLLVLQMEGRITNLRRQVPFILQEEFISKQWGDIKPLMYVADFVYTNINFRKGYFNREIIEDSKGGCLNTVYKNKKKIMLYKYANYLFFEV